ncbi:MAG: CtsR family transcriptional regulator [Bacillota bacterium]|nr:CtsR family transcriptional regulator [Bacillota bacterium]MDW7683392.1 CtsR family transcriptional regulator [Bacillota bacterium]
MGSLADNIESYIKRLLEASPNATILLQRRELADRFQCVPSQINYVLSTRFTPERGYLVESRRGGGGFLRIRHLDLTRDKVAQLLEMLGSLAEQGISLRASADLVNRLTEARLITRREGQLMIAAIEYGNRKVDEGEYCGVRLTVLSRMLEVLLYES